MSKRASKRASSGGPAEDAAAENAQQLAAPAALDEMERQARPLGSEENTVDPVRTLGALDSEELLRLRDMDLQELAAHFEALGLRELPSQIRRNGLNGSVLHSISSEDVSRMEFRVLGEAKAFQELCKKMDRLGKKIERDGCLIERELVFDGRMHEWHEGCLACCNQFGFKEYRTFCEWLGDQFTLAPKKLHTLPRRTVRVFHDHVELSTPVWNRDEIPEEYWELNHAFASPNVQGYHIEEDNIDFANIVDVDVEAQHKVEAYQFTVNDCSKRMCCNDLRRDPGRGDFYWASPSQRCCGYARFFEQRADGIIKITMRHADGHGDTRSFEVVEGAHEVAQEIMRHLEESQLRRAARIATEN